MVITNRKPDFNRILKVLNNDVPDKTTLFEIYFDKPVYEMFAQKKILGVNELDDLNIVVEAFKNAGFDYATTYGCSISFPKSEHKEKASRSANSSWLINSEEDFEKYQFPNPESFDYSKLDAVTLPEGMKLMVMGPGGVLENVTDIVGYENLCYMLYENPDLLAEIFKRVGDILVKYYEISASYEKVGFLCSNDDWGFNTQTFLNRADLEKYVFPYHERIAAACHSAGKKVLLHSCGNTAQVMDFIIKNYDAKHSFEDSILSIEQSYERWGKDIALLGGLDLQYLSSSSEEEITKRCRALVQQTQNKGYALGSGNSIAYYLPFEKFLAMMKVAFE